MELVRVDAPRARRDDVVALSATRTLLVHCPDADTVITVASWRASLERPLGVWLELGARYPAQLAARDVATLAQIVPLAHVVVHSPTEPVQHADVVRALLTNDEVTFANDVANLQGAYNRPAPPREVAVWSYEAGRLRNHDDELRQGRVEKSDDLTLTYFE